MKTPPSAAGSRADDTVTLRDALSVVAPVFNEYDVLEAFCRRLTAVLDGVPMAAQVIFVDDGSSDASPEVLRRLQEADRRIAVLTLSRNFGKEIAITAGLDHARGEAVIIIDTDLQDPPELIPELIRQWRAGYDVVYARRLVRHGESWLKKFTARSFYRLMREVGDVAIPEDTGDFRLLSRRAVEALGQLRERRRFMKGLFAWIGFPQTAVTYQRQPRHAGRSKWNYWRLWNFALEGITSFTTAPLRVATYVGMLTAVAAFFYGAFIIVGKLVWGNPVAGYPSLLTVMLFLGGVQLVTIGIIGEYLGRMFDEIKQRPLYFLSDYRADGLPPGNLPGGATGVQQPEVRGRRDGG